MKNEAKQIKQAEHLMEQKRLKQAAALAHRLLRRRPKSLPILERLFLSAEDLYGAAEALELLRRERPVRQAPIYWLEALLAKKRRQEGRTVKAARHAIELDELSGEPLEQCYGILRDDALDYRGQIAEGVRYMKKIYELWASGGRAEGASRMAFGRGCVLYELSFRDALSAVVPCGALAGCARVSEALHGCRAAPGGDEASAA